jgi:predicted metal-binding membrane protein
MTGHRSAAILLAVAVATGLCWLWIAPMALDMYGPMTGPSAWMMTANWDAPRLALLWAMWTVMMAGMMLPSAAPLLLLYAGAAGANTHAPGSRGRLWALAGGYLVVWTAFSAAATVLQRLLSRLFLLTPMMEMASARGEGVLLLLAGAYQFTPWKHACLRNCRSPLSFIMRRQGSGRHAAFRLGLEHGAYCLGCCWALMLLLFVGGVMNLTVILALTAFVAFEKLGPFGERGARISGALLLLVGVWLLVT